MSACVFESIYKAIFGVSELMIFLQLSFFDQLGLHRSLLNLNWRLLNLDLRLLNLDRWHGDWASLGSRDHLRKVCVLGHEVGWSFARMSDLKHWVWWLNALLAFLTQVVIWSNCALVSDTYDWIRVATITNSIWMNNCGLIRLFLFQMFNQKLLVL